MCLDAIKSPSLGTCVCKHARLHVWSRVTNSNHAFVLNRLQFGKNEQAGVPLAEFKSTFSKWTDLRAHGPTRVHQPLPPLSPAGEGRSGKLGEGPEGGVQAGSRLPQMGHRCRIQGTAGCPITWSDLCSSHSLLMPPARRRPGACTPAPFAAFSCWPLGLHRALPLFTSA